MQQINNLEELKKYLDAAIKSFEQDPATTDFQRGYLASLEEMQILINDC